MSSMWRVALTIPLLLVTVPSSSAQYAAPVDAAAIFGFCRERLASYKVPARLAFRAAGDFPRTATGKIHKPGLRDELARDGTS